MLFGKEHVERCEATDGKEGHDWQNGAPVLILTTTGRSSGEERKTPLIYQEHNGDYLIVASKGGHDQPPAWYLNLQADPGAKAQVWGDRFEVRARDADAEEKADMWSKMTTVWPDYDKYQESTERDIPVVVLERA